MRYFCELYLTLCVLPFVPLQEPRHLSDLNHAEPLHLADCAWAGVSCCARPHSDHLPGLEISCSSEGAVRQLTIEHRQQPLHKRYPSRAGSECLRDNIR